MLSAIEGQTHSVDELVLVFDRCTDGSEVKFQNRGDRRITVSLGNTAAAVRAGIAVASHDSLVLLDGNTLVPPDCVERLMEVIAHRDADLVEWHGGIMALPARTLSRFGPFTDLYLWTLEYFLRVSRMGGTVVRLRGTHERLKRSPLGRNVRYGLEYADLSARYGLSPFFRIGTKSGLVPDLVASGATFIGLARRKHLVRALLWTLGGIRDR